MNKFKGLWIAGALLLGLGACGAEEAEVDELEAAGFALEAEGDEGIRVEIQNIKNGGAEATSDEGIRVEIQDAKSDAAAPPCPPNAPNVVYFSTDPARCSGRLAIRGECDASMGGSFFNLPACGCGCIYSDDGGMQ